MATAKEPEPDPKEGKVRCKNHPEELAAFVCSECPRTPICGECATQLHGNHEMVDIDTHIARARENIQRYVDEIENYKIPEIKEKLQALKFEMERQEQENAEAKKQVEDQAKLVKKHLDTMAKQYTRKLYEEKFENETKLTVHKEHLENLTTEYQMKLRQYETDLIAAVEAGDEERVAQLQQSYPQPPVRPEFPDATMSRFVPGTVDRETLSACLGTFTVNGEEWRDDDPRWEALHNTQPRDDVEANNLPSDRRYDDKNVDEGQENTNKLVSFPSDVDPNTNKFEPIPSDTNSNDFQTKQDVKTTGNVDTHDCATESNNSD